MDSFTENLLSRARERQKMLEGYSSSKRVISSSEPNLESRSTEKVLSPLKNNSEGNIVKFVHQNNTTHISSELTPSPKAHKTLNIQNENFNMEIKVSSADNVRVEVQIEEQNDSDDSTQDKGEGGLRQDAKNRLNRLGKLYAGGDDVDISSPIHQTEAKFHTEEIKKGAKENDKTKRGLRKLADLAKNINQYEDELTPVGKEKKENKPIKRSWKSPAPQPPEAKKKSPGKTPLKPKAPQPPNPHKETSQEVMPSGVKWDKKVLDSLESQGFTRTDSNSRLVYKYNNSSENNVKTAVTSKIIEKNKENVIVEEETLEDPTPKLPSPQKTNLRLGSVIADRAAVFESSPNRTQKDPALLSVSERKALFEKNKGEALVPKAPFAMATPLKAKAPKEKPVKPVNLQPDREVNLQTGNVASKVASLFGGKTTISQEQIESHIREQRQKDMDILLNRFHKTEEANSNVAIKRLDKLQEERIQDVMVDDDDFHDDTTEETAMIDQKPPKIVTTRSEKRSSGGKRCSKSDSPQVVAVLDDVKRIKVSPQKSNRLYPSLTDIESTETETDTRSPTPDNSSSFDGSIAESDDVNTSFGRDILRAVCKNNTPQKILNLDESGTSDFSDILDSRQDYIDEALAYNGTHSNDPTPTKCEQQPAVIETSYSFNYKSFNEPRSPFKKTESPETLPTHVVDGDNVLPLTHTVSFYRKQQTSVATTPVKQISRQPLIEESSNERDDKEEIYSKRRHLKNEVAKQEMIIFQTSQALNLCNSTPEFMGSTEHVEAERVLLVATHRRQVMLHELQRLEVENTLRPQRQNLSHFGLQKGTLTISKIVLPLKQKYVTALAAAGGKGHHVICLVKYGEQVYPTNLVSTVVTDSKDPELELKIPGVMTLKDVYSDFAITFEVYCLQAQEELIPHEVKYHIKKSAAKLTPKKSKQDSRLMWPAKESPAGPQSVRSPTFALMGYIVFCIQTLNKKQWSLNNTPSMSPLQGTVEMSISCQLSQSVEHHGFLTMFEDVSGFGAWHRRWCVLSGNTLSYWKYPDDEKRTPPINSISLDYCITKNVGPVSREICARLHTFLIEIEREAHPQDKESLVTVRKGSMTIIRHLLSADTKEERIEWCNKFNAALSAMTLGKK